MTDERVLEAARRLTISYVTASTAILAASGSQWMFHSVVGVMKEQAIQRFLTQINHKFESASEDVRLHAVVIEVDSKTGKAQTIERIQRR